MVEGKTSNRPEIHRTSWLSRQIQLDTICTSGSCPNMGECWGEGTATFMILGNVCTRSCGLRCKTGRPETLTGTNQKSGAFYQNYEHQTCSSNKR
jgi:lipoate synthase